MWGGFGLVFGIAPLIRLLFFYDMNALVFSGEARFGVSFINILGFFYIYLLIYKDVVLLSNFDYAEKVFWFFYLSLLLLLFTIGSYATFYYELKAISPETVKPEDYLYFSIVTFTTLGYGDFSPISEYRLLAASQALLGYVYLGTIVGLLIVVVSHKKNT